MRYRRSDRNVDFFYQTQGVTPINENSLRTVKHKAALLNPIEPATLSRSRKRLTSTPWIARYSDS